jgi:hypothetical protein
MAWQQYIGYAVTAVSVIVGAVVGFCYGGPFGAGYGAMFGMSFGGMIGGLIQGGVNVFWPERSDLNFSPPPQPHETRLQYSSWGMPIPIQYGSGRMAGNIIYMSDIVETIDRSRHRQDGVRYYEMVKTYTATFAIAFCEEIEAILRIWVNNKVFVDYRDTSSPYYPTGDAALQVGNLSTSIARQTVYFTIYHGTETQTYNPAIAALLTAAETPAYRGTCYIVFIDFPIGEFSGVPNIEIETGPASEITFSEKTYSSGADADNGWVWNLNGALRTDWILVGRDAYGYNKGYMRFINIDLANGITLSSADIHMHLTGGSSLPVDMDIYVELSDNAAALTSGADFLTRTWSTDKVNWYVPSGTDQTTPDISTLVELIVGRPGWVSGNAIQFLFVPTADSPDSHNFIVLDYPNVDYPVFNARFGPY